jgi:deferrochelatase/peroxidase EfeB
LKVQRALSRVDNTRRGGVVVNEAVLEETGKLQEGILLRGADENDPDPCRRKLPRNYAIVLLRAPATTNATRVADLLERLWRMYAGLKDGQVSDLPGVKVEASCLQVLLGFGAPAFRIRECRRELPEPMVKGFSEPRAQGGGTILSPEILGLGDSRIDYDASVRQNPADAAVAIQFLGESQLTVERAIVETWKVLHDEGNTAALEITGVYTGAFREDRRSWIDFHDGLSNLKPEQREKVVKIKDDAEDDWTRGGTYMAFIRLGIDLTAWRDLGVDVETRRAAQEQMVGRDKISGCPIVDFAATNPVGACPVTGKWSDPNHADFREPKTPPATSDDRLRNSHVQRANHHRENVDQPDSLRIFRQGYAFFEPGAGPLGFRAGLNFVSFQDTPARLVNLLTEPTWFGGANFGGPDTIATTTNAVDDTNGSAPHGAPGPLTTAFAAGFFVVPPDGEPFPGASVLIEVSG